MNTICDTGTVDAATHKRMVLQSNFSSNSVLLQIISQILSLFATVVIKVDCQTKEVADFQVYYLHNCSMFV